MKITYSWLKEFTPLTVTPAELATQLTLGGARGGIGRAGGAAVLAASSSARCSSASAIPDADKLSVCEVTTDGENRLQIVCGAPNVRAGLKVAVASGRRAAAGRA